MTLPELLALMMWLALGVASALVGRAVDGAPGAAAGFALGMLSVPIVVMVGDSITRRFVRGPDSGPPCLCGSRELRSERDLQARWVARCRCGEAYVREGGRVLRITPVGALLPCRQWHWRRGWRSIGLRPAHRDAPYRK